MSVHIAAEQGEIAETILLPGDPLRAKYIAETFLANLFCLMKFEGCSVIRELIKENECLSWELGWGFLPFSIYVNELIQSYDVKNLIRVGTMGALQKDVKVRDVVIAQAASTDSRINQNTFPGVDFAPVANFDLLKKAYDAGIRKGLSLKVGNVFSSDRFYNDELDKKQLADYGVLGVEMEAAALYTLAQKYGRNALAILTVSDHILTGEETTALERQTTFGDMIEVALEAAL
ncbi:purine-nucleoside phosphorylase [Listeria aquatica]|uniref:purine-nucleoside phosphorylase n=1 Tax=Listeria aquatica TaxID=1494960 RepID=UPI0031F58210